MDRRTKGTDVTVAKVVAKDDDEVRRRGNGQERAEEEKERHTRELSTLCSIYTALSATLNIDTALFMTAEELQRFERTVLALWRAILQATESRDFRPKQSRLCDWCSFKQWCPAFGGDPSLAATEAVAAHDALIAAPA